MSEMRWNLIQLIIISLGESKIAGMKVKSSFTWFLPGSYIVSRKVTCTRRGNGTKPQECQQAYDADNYLTLAQLYSVMGRLRNSQDYIGKALAIFKQTGDRKGEMESYLTLGSVFSDLGDIITAQNFIKQSIKIADELDMGTARHNQMLSSLSISSENMKMLSDIRKRPCRMPWSSRLWAR